MSSNFEDSIASPVVPGPSSQALELQRRRELALYTTDAISEVLEAEVTVPILQDLSEESEEIVRVAAKRALRCIESIAREDSLVIKAVGKAGIYDYVEGVIDYGASEKTWLHLVDAHQLTAQGATALYALREQVAEYTNGRLPGFAILASALETLGISVPEATADTDAAVAAFAEAGYFVEQATESNGKDAIFWPRGAGAYNRVFDDDPDGTASRESVEWQTDQLNLPPEEREF